MIRKRLLITGGAGFVGRALVDVCLANGCDVAVYDNLSFGRRSNLAPYLDTIAFFENDIRDEAALDRAMDAFRPQAIVHLAALHFIPYCDAHPRETMEVNVVGTHAVMDICARQKVKKVVFASTGAIYASEVHPLNELQDRPAPVDVYGLSKLLGEQICAFFAATMDLNCRVARLFNVYGPHETNAHLIPHIMESLRRGPRVELGNIHTKRDYIYVDDIANILFRYAQTDGSNYTTMNVGTGMEYSAKEIVDCLADLMGKQIEIVSHPKRVRGVDKLHQIADTTSLANLVGVLPQHSIRDGLRKLLIHEGLPCSGNS